MAIFTGAGVAIVTPMHENGDVNYEKLSEILTRMHEEDPTWQIEQSKELKQTIVS